MRAGAEVEVFAAGSLRCLEKDLETRTSSIRPNSKQVEAEPARLDKEALMASLLERAWGASADDLLGCVALTSQQLTPSLSGRVAGGSGGRGVPAPRMRAVFAVPSGWRGVAIIRLSESEQSRTL